MQSSHIRRDKLTISSPRKPVAVKAETQGHMLDTKALFNGARELKIRHNSEVYRLTITKLGKLILTK
ncbi:hemin uptake protein HemP [Roseibium sp.]|uniref:hemin uptake protein HemP n=1 Tax=Roseibium sp. TaxID=1936156 RepID=UPI003A97951C